MFTPPCNQPNLPAVAAGLRGRWLVLVVGLSLAGCTAVAPPALENSVWSTLQQDLHALPGWQLRGRVNVRYDNESWTPRILWQQQQMSYRIRLWGNFNLHHTTIVGRPGQVTLEQDDTVLTASSAEGLIRQQLGYELPVSCLVYWIRGLPSPSSEAELAFNALHQLQQLQQDGWTVTYSDLRQYGRLSLPRRVEVSRAQHDLRLRFVGLHWTLEPTT